MNPPPPPEPKANFKAVPSTGQVPLKVDFTDLSIGNPTSWKWEFGDDAVFRDLLPGYLHPATTSTEQNPWHFCVVPGEYDVKLTVTNATGSDTKVRSITALPRPIWSSDSVRFFKYTGLGDDVHFDTRIPSRRYYCGIVGMAARNGDIQEDGHGDILRTFMYVEDYTWRVRADFRSEEDEDWDIYTMCLDRGLEGVGFAYQNFDKLGDNVTLPTSYSTSDYTCGIVGMAAYDGDIQEDDAGDILLAYMEPKGDKWQIRADFRSHKEHESWTVDVICFNNEPESLYEKSPWIYRHYPNRKDNVSFNTGIDLDYVCGIVGMAARNGDINENGTGHIFRTFMYEQGGEWWIRADFRSHDDHENWDINVLCASTTIAKKSW